jgi:hypothetical protein
MARPRNKIRTERAQISLSDNANRILQELVPLGIHGKTKAEIVGGIVNRWIWDNEDRLLRQGIKVRPQKKSSLK